MVEVKDGVDRGEGVKKTTPEGSFREEGEW